MAGTEDQALQDLSDMVMAGVADLWIALVLGRTDHGRSGGELRLVQQVLGQVSHRRLANYSSIANVEPAGWTENSWGSAPPWTSWSACTASTTATATTTLTITDSAGSQITSVSTSYGIKVAQATGNTVATTTDSSGNSVTTTNSDSGAMATNFAFAGSAAGVIGIAAAALML